MESPSVFFLVARVQTIQRRVDGSYQYYLGRTRSSRCWTPARPTVTAATAGPGAARRGRTCSAGSSRARSTVYFVKLICTVSSLFLDSFVVHSGRFGLSGFLLVLFGYFISEWVFL